MPIPIVERALPVVSLLVVTLFVLGCPGFGTQEPESALGEGSSPLCESVESIMALRCNECHSATPEGGAPGYFRTDVLLDSGDTLGAASMSDRLLVRSEDGTMPPSGAISGAVTSAELDVLRQWHAAGAPVTDCVGGGVDAGTDAGVEADGGDAGDVGTADSGSDDVATCTDSCPTLADVQAQIFTPGCATPFCHVGSAASEGLPLEGDGLLQRLLEPSSQVPEMALVTPGEPENSYLYLKVTGEHTTLSPRTLQMPLSGELPAADIELLRLWIASGAN